MHAACALHRSERTSSAYRRAECLEDLTLLLPSDVVNHVLCWLHEQEGIEALRLEALVSLYGLSARSYSIQLPPSYDSLLLRCISSQVQLPVLLVSARGLLKACCSITCDSRPCCSISC